MMNSKISLTLRTVVALILTTSLVSAKLDEGNGSARKAKGRVAYVVYTGGGSFFDEPVTVRSGKRNTRIQLSKRSASQPIKINADGELLFIKENPANKENPFEVYAKAVIPEGIQKALVVISPLPKPKDGMLFSSQIVSLANFRQGDWLFINLTPRDVAVKIGEEKIGIKPGEAGTYDGSNINKPTNKSISYAYYHEVVPLPLPVNFEFY